MSVYFDTYHSEGDDGPREVRNSVRSHTESELVEAVRTIALDDTIDPNKALMAILDVCEDALSDDQSVGPFKTPEQDAAAEWASYTKEKP